MGKLVVAEPGRTPRLVEHEGPVRLEDIHRLVGTGFLDARSLGRLPSGLRVAMWVDDHGLLGSAPPNRRMPNGAFICGTLVLTGVQGDEDVSFDDDDADWLLRDIDERWQVLAADEPKPEPTFTVVTAATPEDLLRKLFGGKAP